MRKNGSRLLKLNFYKKLFLYFLIIALFILTVSFLSTQFYLHFFEKKLEERYQISLDILGNVIDTSILESLKRAESYAWTNELDGLRESKNLFRDYPKGFPLFGTQIYTYVHSIFYINLKSRSVVDKYSVQKYNDFMKTYYPGIDPDDFINDIEKKSITIYRPTVFRENKLTSDYVLPYIVYDRGRKDNVILVNIDLKKISFLMVQFSLTRNSNILLLDSQGNIITSSDYILSKYYGYEDLDFYSFLKKNTIKMKEKFKMSSWNMQRALRYFNEKKIEDAGVLKSIRETSPVRADIFDGKRLVLSSESMMPYTSRVFYAATIPYSDLYINAIPIDKIAVAVSLICLLLSLVFSLIMSRFLYNPVKELLSLIRPLAGFKKNNDEFGAISGKISELLADRDRLTRSLTMALPMVSENYLLKILNENIIFMEDELRAFLRENNITFRHPNFIVSMIRLYFNDEFYRDFNRQEQFGIINETYRLFKNAFNDPDDVYLLTLNKNEICIIFNLPVEVNPGMLLDSFVRILKIYKYKKEKYIDVFCGFGRLHYGIKGMVESYKDAVQSISDLNLFGEERIKVFVPKTNFDIQYVFTLNEENQFLNYLLTGFKNEALNIVKEIVEKNQKRNITGNMQKELYVRLYYTCIRALNIKDISPAHLMDREHIDLSREYHNLSLDRISEHVFNMVIKITDLSKNIQTGKFEINNVINFINSNFTKDISLENIAMEYNVSTPHLSRLLKEHLSMSFQKYLNNLRMKKAKFLLNSTSKGIDEISSECGFNSRFTFIRMFKISEGITPTQFRDIKLGNRKN